MGRLGRYIWYSEEGPGRSDGPAQSPHRCTKCNSPPIDDQCTDHCIDNGPLFCGFSVAIKGLTQQNKPNGYSLRLDETTPTGDIPPGNYPLYRKFKRLHSPVSGSYPTRVGVISGGGGISREVLFAHHSFHQRSKIINDVARIMRTGRV